MKICCIPINKLNEQIRNATKSFKENIFEYIKDDDILWIERSVAEKDFNFKQIIPYVILKKHDGQIACYKRHGTEKRLHGLYSCGFGGHIDEPDNSNSLFSTIENGMYRELSEELANFDDKKISLKYKGFIHEVESEVGLLHIGIVYLAECSEGYEPLETYETKGLEWKSISELKSLKTELWSKLAMELIN